MEVGLYIMSMVFVSNSFYKDVGPDRTQWEVEDIYRRINNDKP